MFEGQRFSLLSPPLSPVCPPAAAVASGDEPGLLTPGRMSQRQVKEKDREREKEAGLQTPSREHMASPSALSPGVSYSHGKPRPHLSYRLASLSFLFLFFSN